jgi:large subunit ribosomal protein L21
LIAIIETGGKQYKVTTGDTVLVEKLDAAQDEEVVIEKVLLVAEGENVQIGQPYVAGAKVTAKVEGQLLGPKIRGFKFRAKKNYRKRYGHRQPYTRLRIESIEAGA